jgi:hypothetical protein
VRPESQSIGEAQFRPRHRGGRRFHPHSPRRGGKLIVSRIRKSSSNRKPGLSSTPSGILEITSDHFVSAGKLLRVSVLVMLDRDQRWSAKVRGQYFEQYVHHWCVGLVIDGLIDVAGSKKKSPGP